MRTLIVTRDEANDRWIITKRVPGPFGERRNWYYTRLAVLAAIERWQGTVKIRAKRRAR